MMNCEENNSSPAASRFHDFNNCIYHKYINNSNRRIGVQVVIFDFDHAQTLDSGLEAGLTGPELDHVMKHRLVSLPRPPDGGLWPDLRVSRGDGHTEAGGPQATNTHINTNTVPIYLGNRVDSDDLFKLQLDLDGERRLTFCFLIFRLFEEAARL